MKEIYNASWKDNWGFVPLTDAEFNFKAESPIRGSYTSRG